MSNQSRWPAWSGLLLCISAFLWGAPAQAAAIDPQTTSDRWIWMILGIVVILLLFLIGYLIHGMHTDDPEPTEKQEPAYVPYTPVAPSRTVQQTADASADVSPSDASSQPDVEPDEAAAPEESAGATPVQEPPASPADAPSPVQTDAMPATEREATQVPDQQTDQTDASAQQPPIRFCRYCGQELNATQRFCQRCGHRVRE